MPYHLDTDICAAAMRGAANVQDRMRQHVGELYVSAIVLGELYCGALWSQRVARNLARHFQYVQGLAMEDWMN